MGRLKENWRPTVLRIFQSVVDRSEASQTLWSAYGLKLGVPKEYKLERQKLLSGYLLFAFGAKPARFRIPINIAKLIANRLRKTNGPVENIDFSPPDKGRLSVERYGPAEILLSEYKNDPNPLEAWFRTKYAKAIRGLRI